MIVAESTFYSVGRASESGMDAHFRALSALRTQTVICLLCWSMARYNIVRFSWGYAVVSTPGEPTFSCASPLSSNHTQATWRKQCGRSAETPTPLSRWVLSRRCRHPCLSNCHAIWPDARDHQLAMFWRPILGRRRLVPERSRQETSAALISQRSSVPRNSIRHVAGNSRGRYVFHG